MTPCPGVIGDGGARKEGGVDMKHISAADKVVMGGGVKCASGGPRTIIRGSRGGVRGEGHWWGGGGGSKRMGGNV